jgi:hypothetical protein
MIVEERRADGTDVGTQWIVGYFSDCGDVVRELRCVSN